MTILSITSWRTIQTGRSASFTNRVTAGTETLASTLIPRVWLQKASKMVWAATLRVKVNN
jgi:hypothetical protein